MKHLLLYLVISFCVALVYVAKDMEENRKPYSLWRKIIELGIVTVFFPIIIITSIYEIIKN